MSNPYSEEYLENEYENRPIYSWLIQIGDYEEWVDDSEEDSALCTEKELMKDAKENNLRISCVIDSRSEEEPEEPSDYEMMQSFGTKWHDGL